MACQPLSLSTPPAFAADPGAAAGGFRILTGSGLQLNEDQAPTLAAALDLVARARASHPMDPVTIELPPGTVRLAATAVITAAHASNETAPLLIRGAADHSTRIVGSAPFALAPVRVGDLPAGCCPGLAHHEARRLDLRAIAPSDTLDLVGVSSYRPGIEQRIALFQHRRRLSPSRWPATGYASDAALIDAGDKSRGPAVALPVDQQAAFAREPALWIGGYWFRDWTYETAPVVAITGDPPKAEFRVRRLFIPYPPSPNFRYFVSNAYAALAEPGTFVLDAKAGGAVLLPIEAADEAVDVARVATLLKISGAQRVSVEDLAFEETLGTAIVVDGAKDITLRRIGVRNTGDGAIAITGSSQVLVTDIVATHLGGAGVVADAGVRRTLTPGRITVRRSMFTHFGELSRAYAPGVELRGVGNRVIGCYFSEAPHSALVIYGNDHRIEDNEIANVVTETGDAGAVYFKGFDWTERGTIVRGNFVHDIGFGKDARPAVYGIYLDGGLSGATVSGNVFARVARPLFIHGGRDNRVTRNLFDAPSTPPVLLGGTTLTTRAEWDKGGTMRRALEAMPTGNPLWSSRYPELRTLPSSAFELPENNRLAENIVTSPVDLVELLSPDYRRLLDERGTRRSALQGSGLQRVQRSRADELRSLPYATWFAGATR